VSFGPIRSCRRAGASAGSNLNHLISVAPRGQPACCRPSHRAIFSAPLQRSPLPAVKVTLTTVDASAASVTWWARPNGTLASPRSWRLRSGGFGGIAQLEGLLLGRGGSGRVVPDPFRRVPQFNRPVAD